MAQLVRAQVVGSGTTTMDAERFSGSETPLPVGTGSSPSMTPAVSIMVGGTPCATRKSATARARRSASTRLRAGLPVRSVKPMIQIWTSFMSDIMTAAAAACTCPPGVRSALFLLKLIEVIGRGSGAPGADGVPLAPTSAADPLSVPSGAHVARLERGELQVEGKAVLKAGKIGAQALQLRITIGQRRRHLGDRRIAGGKGLAHHHEVGLTCRDRLAKRGDLIRKIGQCRVGRRDHGRHLGRRCGCRVRCLTGSRGEGRRPLVSGEDTGLHGEHTGKNKSRGPCDKSDIMPHHCLYGPCPLFV